MKIRSGYYTTDTSDLYFNVRVKYQNEQYVKAKVQLFYKYGELKDTLIEQKNYKIQKKNIGHWKQHKEVRC